MDRYAFAWAFVLLSGCGGATVLSSTTVVSTQSPARQVFECAGDHLEALGYSTHSIDKNDQRLVVRKVDKAVQRSDPNFGQAIDQVTVEVTEPAAARGATLTVTARSFFEYRRRGYSPSLQEREATTIAKSAAEAALEKCAPDAEAVGS